MTAAELQTLIEYFLTGAAGIVSGAALVYALLKCGL